MRSLTLQDIADAVSCGLTDWTSNRIPDDSEVMIEEAKGNVVDGKFEILGSISGREFIVTVESV